jgi:protein TonB
VEAAPEIRPETQTARAPAAAAAPETEPALETARTEATGDDASSAPAGTQGRAGVSDGDEAGDGNASASGGTPGTTVDYGARLLAWLERHKQYPPRARDRRQEGAVMLYLAIARDGAVLAYRIREGSGHAALDHATLEMVERASPLPPFPDGIDRDRLELIVPVRYAIR